MQETLPRKAEEDLISLLSSFPAVALLGPRQAGKTTLAQMLAKGSFQESEYLDLESPADLARLSDPELYLKRHQNRLVILDEIQQAPDLFPVLRSLIDRSRTPGRFLVLGSASPELLKQSSESLAGRIFYYELSPFHSLEVRDHEKLWFRGGFPPSYLAPNGKASRDWLRSFIMTYLNRDVPFLGIRIPPPQLGRFWEMLAHLQGQTWNASKIAANFGVTSPTIKRYLSVLEETYLVRQVYPYAANVKKRLVKTPKVYIRDSGLLHALLRIPSPERLFGHPIIGASYEGWAIEQICAALSQREIRPYFYRTHAGAEIDLVMDTGSTLIPIEIKHTLTPKPSRGFFEAMKDLGCKGGYVVYPGKERYPLGPEIEVIPLNLLIEELARLPGKTD